LNIDEAVSFLEKSDRSVAATIIKNLIF